jgi:LysM repeat protein
MGTLLGRAFFRLVICGFFFGFIYCLLAAGGCTPAKPYVSNYSPPPSRPGPSTSPQAPGSGGSAPAGARVQVVERPLAVSGAEGSVVHEVGPLETVWRISKMYDVPMEDICRANGMRTEDTLKIGQKLVIPDAKVFRNIIPLYPNGRWKYIIIHHTATEIGKALIIDRAHNDRGFWKGLGYHFLIDNGTLGKGDGQIEAAPRWIKQQTGAHCKAGGMNSEGIGIALVGNFNYENPTPKQLDSLTYLVQTLMGYYHISSSNIKGHRDVVGANTDCPGKLFPWTHLRQCLAR